MTCSKSELIELVQNLITLLNVRAPAEKRQTIVTAVYVTIKTIGLLIEMDPKAAKFLASLSFEDFHE